MQQDDQRSLAGLDVMQPLVADLGVALTNFAAQEFFCLLFRRRARAAGVVLGIAHCCLPGGCARGDGNDLTRWIAPLITLVALLVCAAAANPTSATASEP